MPSIISVPYNLGLSENNYKQFLKYYNDFQNECIRQIEYDTKKSEIQIIFDVWTLDGSSLKNNNIYEGKPKKLKMIFKNISKFDKNNVPLNNYIDYTYMDFYHQNGKKLICFSLNSEDPDEEPYLYITCETIEYEEIKDRNDDVEKF